MGKFDIEPSPGLLKMLSLADSDFIDEVAPKMLNEAAPLVVSAIQNNAPYTELANAVKFSKPKKTKEGSWISAVYVDGKKSVSRGTEEVPMMVYAAWTEYGHATNNADKTKVVAAKPFLRPGITKSSKEANAKMVEVWNRELEKIIGG